MRRPTRPRAPRDARTADRASLSREGRSSSARDRYLALDSYRVRREWARFEGTAQRDLFRELRIRFLARNAVGSGPSLEIGPGPGRFSPHIGTPTSRRVLLDLSVRALEAARERLGRVKGPAVPFHFVRGDAVRAPFRVGGFQVVAALGNTLGFSGQGARAFLGPVLDLVEEGGRVVLETVAGPGERSRYLTRLPPGALRRLLRAPLGALMPRIEREGFEPLPDRDPGRHGFRRFRASDLEPILSQHGLEPLETMAVAPALGSDPARLDSVSRDPAAWDRLEALEESIGRVPARLKNASAVLIAARRPSSSGRPNTTN